MEMSLHDMAHELGKKFELRASLHDRDGSFVKENYLELKELKYFSALIPEELGGGGMSHSEMCDILRIISQYCGSTALAMSMHQHLISANVWKYKNGQGAEDTLRKIASKNLILVSTGAKDWLESNGDMIKVDGGYLVTATKHFTSQAPIGDMMIISAPYKDPDKGWQVLHFPVPYGADGVSVMDNWDTLGMRGTGSHSTKLENVFVPDSAIVLARPQGEYHPVFNVVLTVAMPLIMAVYVGVAEKAASMAIQFAKGIVKPKDHLISAIGKLNNTLTNARLNWESMIRITNDFDFKPIKINGHEMITRKTNVAHSCIDTVTQAMEIVGGQGYFKKMQLERLFRDVQGAKYHPYQEQEQLLFSGEFLLKENI